ncbi:exosortase/archaeosortase family protein [Cerasicoccus maritimus]|uniref:exosortase/archaeosortase family protein n=1 Tax=Cerasicoccus maritimus TaxID=490089 RepID=UPI0028528154|nr:exosortase/archaeosortase family protein [Cerasicoccus maritimus]
MPDPADQPIDLEPPAPKETPVVDWPIMLATYLGAMLIFYPLIQWLFHTTESSEQLLHALIVLGAAGMFLLLEKRRRLSLVLAHDKQSVTLLAISFSIVAVCLLPLQWETSAGSFAKATLLLVGFGFTLAGLVRYTLGPIAAKASRGFIIAFTFFMFLALSLPILDWPLRALAGRGSMNLLAKLGVGAELQLVNIPSPELVLNVAGRPFIVAAECNGFGLLSASILLAILLAIYRKLNALDFSLVIILTVVTAFIANTLRILVIVLLAPKVENYLLMHEIVGLIFFYSALGFLWWYIHGFGQGSKKQTA